MRPYLLATTAAMGVATPALGQTVIDGRRTEPVRTSTVRNGAPDAIRIVSTGSVNPASGTAVTIDSPHSVTNQGSIQVSNANGAVGIDAVAGTGGGISNSGTITIDEGYAPADADNDGDLDGPLASGTGRFGIRTAGGYAGTIVQSGRIVVEGNDSAGILLGGPLSGALSHDGETGVVGDRTVGVRAGAVVGNIRLAGRVSAQGQGTIGAHLAGDVTGAVVVQGTIGSTGYRYPTAPADPSKLDADDLLQGGPALLIEGSVTGGIILAVPPRDLVAADPDEDKDGIEDAKEGSAAVGSFGAAPAMQVGATDRAIAIGPVAGTGFGMVIDGQVAGSGVYAGVEGNGLAIGGRGGAVTVAGGIAVAGTVQATANGASATAIRLGAGASSPELRISGTVSAAGGGTAASRATAILVEAGAALPVIRNSGTIRAGAQAGDGSAAAIADRSGSVRLVETSGAISATGATAGSDRNIAIDLSAATGGTVVRQTAVAAGVTAPSINGDLRFGGYGDVLDVLDGSVAGTARFGEGNNRLALSGDATFTGAAVFGAGADALALSGTAAFTGTADLGGGADTLTLGGTARFAGRLLNAGAAAVAVGSGTLDLAGPAAIGTLTVASGGVLVATLDRAAATGTAIQVGGTASFDRDAVLALRIGSLAGAEGRHVVLRAGTLTGAAGLTVRDTMLPFLFKGTLAASAGNEVAIDIARKTAAELGLAAASAGALDPALAALAGDAKMGGAFLGITDAAVFRASFAQLLPDRGEGTFEAVTQGSRAIARVIADPHGMYKDEGRWGWWLAQLGYSGSRDATGAAAAYDVSGWGTAAGVEVKTKLGTVGASLAYLDGRSTEEPTDNRVTTNQYEAAGYWRGRWAGLQANLRGSVAKVDLDGTRRFAGVNGTERVERTAKGDRGGTLVAFSGGASYEMGGAVAFFRPVVALDYHRLSEDGYTETGGGSGFDLSVDRRISDELAVTGSVAGGLDFFGGYQGEGWFRLEAEGGRREVIGGELGATVARFGSGARFTVLPEERDGGWVGKLRTIGGTRLFRLGAEFNAEERGNDWILSLRASLQVGL